MTALDSSRDSWVLSKDEEERAARFYSEELRMRFRNARTFLRRVLADYSGEAPEKLEFSYLPAGKPFLSRHPGLYFNLSHSGNLAVLAICLWAPVGLDVEEVRPVSDVAAIAKRFFTFAEQEEIMNHPPVERLRAFFLCWTRKEAVLKATGEGISGIARMLDSARNAESFEPIPGYVGAVAIHKP